MTELDEFLVLAGEWHQARDALSAAQLTLDLKFVNFLQGKGPAPIRKEMKHVGKLRFYECEKRDAMNEFIAITLD